MIHLNDSLYILKMLQTAIIRILIHECANVLHFGKTSSAGKVVVKNNKKSSLDFRQLLVKSSVASKKILISRIFVLL